MNICTKTDIRNKQLSFASLSWTQKAYPLFDWGKLFRHVSKKKKGKMMKFQRLISLKMLWDLPFAFYSKLKTLLRPTQKKRRRSNVHSFTDTLPWLKTYSVSWLFWALAVIPLWYSTLVSTFWKSQLCLIPVRYFLAMRYGVYYLASLCYNFLFGVHG